MADETNTEGATSNSFTAVPTTFTIDGFEPRKHRWNRWIQHMEGSFKVFGVGEDLQEQYVLHYIGMEAYNYIMRQN